MRFWSDAQKTLIFGTSLVAPKIRKIGPRSAREAIFHSEGAAEDSIFGDLGPWGGLARDKILDTRSKKHETRSKKQETRSKKHGTRRNKAS